MTKAIQAPTDLPEPGDLRLARFLATRSDELRAQVVDSDSAMRRLARTPGSDASQGIVGSIAGVMVAGLLLLGALGLVFVAAGGLDRNAPTARPSAPPTVLDPKAVPPFTETYQSAQHAYSVGYPAGWEVRPASGPWPPGRGLPAGSPELDAITGRAHDGAVRFEGASLALNGMTEDEFRAMASASECDGSPLPDPLLIDGQPATVTLNGCPTLTTLGGAIWDVIVFKGGRAYDFTLDGHLNAEEAAAWLATVRLTP